MGLAVVGVGTPVAFLMLEWEWFHMLCPTLCSLLELVSAFQAKLQLPFSLAMPQTRFAD
jgi:hypothetical protein